MAPTHDHFFLRVRSRHDSKVRLVLDHSEHFMKPTVITLADYYKLHGQPTVAALHENAAEWVRRANIVLEFAALDDVHPGIDQVSGNPVASGYRPAGVNARTSNAAVASTHLTCEGGDVQDHPDRRLAMWCVRNLDVLERVGIWMEDPRWTGGRPRKPGEGDRDPWCHWQIRAPRSGKRVYIPYADQVKNPPNDPDFFERLKRAP